jgi:hypothetical protein
MKTKSQNHTGGNYMKESLNLIRLLVMVGAVVMFAGIIYETGQREVDDKGVPETSEWAKKYSCGPRLKGEEAVDTKAGYVYDSTRLNQLRPGWGLLPAPGKAQVYVYPDCKDGRVVADVIRLDKGHTEGLEPKVTEELVKLMLSAKGGKIQQSH